MGRLYWISFLIGTIEITLVTFLTTMAFQNAGVWVPALLGYFIYCFFLGGTLKSVLILAAMGLVLTLSYSYYGFWGTAGIYLLIVVAIELGPLVRGRRRSS